MQESEPGEIDWGLVFTRAIAAATELWSPERAEETVSAGMERILAGEAPWDPNGKLTIEEHVIAVGYNVKRNERRGLQRRRRGAFVAEVARGLAEGGPRGIEEAYEDREERANLLAALLDACEEAPDARAIVIAEGRGVLGRRAQMEHCKLTELQWATARKHIGRMLKEVMAEDSAEEERE